MSELLWAQEISQRIKEKEKVRGDCKQCALKKEGRKER